MEISGYILSGNLLGIWIVLLLLVAGLLLAKIDLRDSAIINYSILFCQEANSLSSTGVNLDEPFL